MEEHGVLINVYGANVYAQIHFYYFYSYLSVRFHSLGLYLSCRLLQSGDCTTQ